MNTKTESGVRILAESAILIAVGTVLAQLQLFRMPNGGSVTVVSMLPFILISFRHGSRWGCSQVLQTACLRCCSAACMRLRLGRRPLWPER